MKNKLLSAHAISYLWSIYYNSKPIHTNQCLSTLYRGNFRMLSDTTECWKKMSPPIWIINHHYLQSVAAVAAAKSLQSCPTLCNPIDGSPPGSSVPGILQARILEWVAISFCNAWKWKGKVKPLSRARLLAMKSKRRSWSLFACTWSSHSSSTRPCASAEADFSTSSRDGPCEVSASLCTGNGHKSSSGHVA